jgi:hypothetical protein
MWRPRAAGAGINQLFLISVDLVADSTFFGQMRTLLFDEDHCDVEFIVGPGKDRVTAHRAVLTARWVSWRAREPWC